MESKLRITVAQPDAQSCATHHAQSVLHNLICIITLLILRRRALVLFATGVGILLPEACCKIGSYVRCATLCAYVCCVCANDMSCQTMPSLCCARSCPTVTCIANSSGARYYDVMPCRERLCKRIRARPIAKTCHGRAGCT